MNVGDHTLLPLHSLKNQWNHAGIKYINALFIILTVFLYSTHTLCNKPVQAISSRPPLSIFPAERFTPPLGNSAHAGIHFRCVIAAYQCHPFDRWLRLRQPQLLSHRYGDVLTYHMYTHCKMKAISGPSDCAIHVFGGDVSILLTVKPPQMHANCTRALKTN
jgi:hypothetical protein